MVITIIAVLLALLLPTFERARAIANTTACASNKRQIGVALSSYTMDYDGQVPIPQVWHVMHAWTLIARHSTVAGAAPAAYKPADLNAPLNLALLHGEQYLDSHRVLFCPEHEDSDIDDAPFPSQNGILVSYNYYAYDFPNRPAYGLELERLPANTLLAWDRPKAGFHWHGGTWPVLIQDLSVPVVDGDDPSETRDANWWARQWPSANTVVNFTNHRDEISEELP